MTKEEAAKMIKDDMRLHHDYLSGEYRKALKIAIKALEEAEIIYCKYCKHHWTHKCMDSMLIERCDLEQTIYDVEHDFCSMAERRTNA